MASKVRAKMFVAEVTKQVGQGQGAQPCGKVKLQVVYGDSEENKTFSKYTPSGSVELYITNSEAYEAFELGKSYYIDFTPAE
jgi:hypothetical protein